MHIVLGSDHAGPDLKAYVRHHLESQGHRVTDVGTHSAESTDYPDWAAQAASLVTAGDAELGILICGSGVGIGISANKIHGIRCGIVSEPYSAAMSRKHNDANMIAFGARVVGPDLALMIVDAFVSGEFEGGRHQRRVDKITALDAAR